ncbi:MAG TPA: hypothetical protein VGC99_28765 [Candidatus Tectomicrobia bacterium]
MQMYKFFDLKTPGDLLRKLEREYDRWKADPLNVDVAWNFFVTVEHLPDWIYYQDMPTSGKPRPDLLDGEEPYVFKMALTRPLLRICSHLANGAKHFHLRNTNLTSVDRTVIEPRSYVADGYVADGYFAKEPMLVVYLSHDEVAALQQAGVPVTAEDNEVLWIAARVLEFWQAWLVLHPSS